MKESIGTPWWETAKRELDQRRGKSQAGLSRFLGCTEGNVSLLLGGHRNAKFDTVLLIAKYLGMNVVELIGEDRYFLTQLDEQEWIDLYRSIPEDRRQELAAVFRSIVLTTLK